MAPTTSTTNTNTNTNTKQLNTKGVVHSRHNSGKYEAMRRRAIVQLMTLTVEEMNDKDMKAYYTDIQAVAQAAMNMGNDSHCKDSIPTWIFIKPGGDNIWEEGHDGTDGVDR